MPRPIFAGPDGPARDPWHRALLHGLHDALRPDPIGLPAVSFLVLEVDEGCDQYNDQQIEHQGPSATITWADASLDVRLDFGIAEPPLQFRHCKHALLWRYQLRAEASVDSDVLPSGVTYSQMSTMTLDMNVSLDRHQDDSWWRAASKGNAGISRSGVGKAWGRPLDGEVNEGNCTPWAPDPVHSHEPTVPREQVPGATMARHRTRAEPVRAR